MKDNCIVQKQLLLKNMYVQCAGVEEKEASIFTSAHRRKQNRLNTHTHTLTHTRARARARNRVLRTKLDDHYVS